MGAIFRRPKTNVTLFANNKAVRLSYVPKFSNAPITSLYMHVADTGSARAGWQRLAPGSFALVDRQNPTRVLMPESLNTSHDTIPAEVEVQLSPDAKELHTLLTQRQASSPQRVIELEERLENAWQKYKRTKEVTGFQWLTNPARPVGRAVRYMPGIRE